MRLYGSLLCVAGVVLVGLLAGEARADKKAVKFTQNWKGSVADETLQKDAPECITNAKALEKLWKAWKIDGKVPEVDFTKEMVVIGTGNGGSLNVSANLDDKGNLEVVGFGTLDLVAGFRYVIATVPKEGVKTVNKKELPKE